MVARQKGAAFQKILRILAFRSNGCQNGHCCTESGLWHGAFLNMKTLTTKHSMLWDETLKTGLK